MILDNYVKYDPDRSTLTSHSKHNLKGREMILIALEPQETGKKLLTVNRYPLWTPRGRRIQKVG